MEDRGIVHSYLILNLTIKNFELDLLKIKNSALKIKEPYVQLIEGMIYKAINKRRKLKQKKKPQLNEVFSF